MRMRAEAPRKAPLAQQVVPNERPNKFAATGAGLRTRTARKAPLAKQAIPKSRNRKTVT